MYTDKKAFNRQKSNVFYMAFYRGHQTLDLKIITMSDTSAELCLAWLCLVYCQHTHEASVVSIGVGVGSSTEIGGLSIFSIGVQA
jgi:hypothetical protein